MSITEAPEDIASIVAEAYVFAFPMLMGYRFGYATCIEPLSPAYRGEVNDGPHGEAVTLDHTYADVITPNADTPYSFGVLDLRGGPVVLTVPEVKDRYYVIQLEDLFGYNELFIGSRATGTGAGSHLLIGPRWEGEVPAGYTSSFRFETDLVFVGGRTQLLGPSDQAACAEIMAQYRLEPLAVHQGGSARDLPPFDWPRWDDGASRDERFVGFVNQLLTLCKPPHPDEAAMFERFATVGIGHGLPFDAAALSEEERWAFREGIAAGRKTMTDAVDSIGERMNGWVGADLFGDRSFYEGDYLKRAAGAMAGWAGNDKVEAYYPTLRADSNGDSLDGNAHYELTFETPPPVNAFWSVTMYDTSYDGVAGYLVENPIDRFLISSTTEGLVLDSDGSLTMTIQRDEPSDPTKRSNWLPTPDGSFYLTLRMYWPQPDALDGTWRPPPIQLVD